MKYGGREVGDDKNGRKHVVCALIIFFFCTLIYIIKIIYLYPPTRVWGTGLGGGTKAQPVPQPQLNPRIYPRVSPTHDNPYL